MLGGATQDVEGVLDGDAFEFDKDALGLADVFTGSEGLVEVGDAVFVIGSFAGGVEGHRWGETMGRSLEARIERFRSHVRRPNLPNNQ